MFEKPQVLELKFLLEADLVDFLTLYYIRHKIQFSTFKEDPDSDNIQRWKTMSIDDRIIM